MDLDPDLSLFFLKYSRLFLAMDHSLILFNIMLFVKYKYSFLFKKVFQNKT